MASIRSNLVPKDHNIHESVGTVELIAGFGCRIQHLIGFRSAIAQVLFRSDRALDFLSCRPRKFTLDPEL